MWYGRKLLWARQLEALPKRYEELRGSYKVFEKARCEQYAIRTGVAISLLKKHVFGSSNNPQGVKPPEGTPFGLEYL
ncbi:uncharacterized protein LAJ45_10015 [Morchella importuna]|uniref:uncharacterized protein n=1 Tax=Morchella importuna TaxID=1174673 RepID=UPI001E8DC8F1|nr:uncharacterized protein LAJ45_10015 [Morchella importuna]KAH8145873.1 hypothetical protein LAJ45_10015 [Morchella importuna]